MLSAVSPTRLGLLALGLLCACSSPTSAPPDAEVGSTGGLNGGLDGATVDSGGGTTGVGADAASPVEGGPTTGTVDGGLEAGSDGSADDGRWVPPPLAPWDPPTPAPRPAEECGGVASGCAGRSNSACILGAGCSLDGDCRGVSESCYSQYSSYACRDLDGCVWSSYNDRCSGSSWSCSSYSSSSGCTFQDGCYWTESCTGVATRCSELGPYSCEDQLGCYLACPSGYASCDGECVDLLDDEDHCGSCGFDCGDRGDCVNGACTCAEPFTVCDGSCTWLLVDEDNCGACGNHCGSGQLCEDGACVDEDECVTRFPCSGGRECTNLDPGFECGPCPQGFQAAGATGCVDINECASNNGGCDPVARCINSPGSFACGDCPAGYTGSGDTACVDIDECASNNGGCDPLTSCTNTDGGRTCSPCPAGYSGTGSAGCTDINECSAGNGGCDPLTTCTNTAGSRTCGDCPTGYTGDGEAGCVDVNECATDNGGCDPLRACSNTPGGRTCRNCPSGYTNLGVTACQDVNECATDNGGCDPLTECTNTVGSRTCGDCPEGYTGDGESGCIDINECATDNGGCDPLTSCTNVDGGRTCGACPTGYTGDGDSGCEDVDECATENGYCDPLRECRNFDGGSECLGCPENYAPEGFADCAPLLQGLTPSAGTLEPAFDPAIRTYTLELPAGADELTLTAQFVDAFRARVSGEMLTSGVASSPLSLVAKRGTVWVTVDDLTRFESYRIDVHGSFEHQFVPCYSADAPDYCDATHTAIDEDMLVVRSEVDLNDELTTYLQADGTFELEDNQPMPPAWAPHRLDGGLLSYGGAHAAVYNREFPEWSQQGYWESASQGIDVSISVADDWVLVGDPGDGDFTDGNSYLVGKVEVYSSAILPMTLIETLLPPTSESDQRFGWQVAASGTTAVIANPGAGSLRVYERVTYSYGEVQALPFQGTNVGALELEEDLLVVGGGGRTVVHERVNGSFGPAIRLALPDGSDIGGPIATDGTLVFVGDRLHDGAGSGVLLTDDAGFAYNRGAVHVFAKVHGNWTRIYYLKPSVENASYFGSSLDYDGTWLAATHGRGTELYRITP